MPQHFLREIEALKQKLLGLSAMVEERIAKAIDSVVKHDAGLALEVVEGDNEVDQMEVEVEEDCLKLLALYQPVAVDLRFVVAVLKINNDLERMADKAVNIARRAEYLAQYPRQTLPSSLTAMAREVELMVRHSLDALVQDDTMMARQVCADDRAVDRYNREIHREIQEQIRSNPDDVERLVHTLSVARHLERIGDLATNVAEDVIYTVEGEIVRHRTGAYA